MNETLSPPDCSTLADLVRQNITGAEVDVGLFSGNDHFDMRVVSNAFSGKNRVARHQMVYQALGDYMQTGIHALALKTLTPEETGENK
ncbi:MAG: BolA family protein [Mariprofundaceae bacterium]|nr:BolA family protein [Mariprofundaceae bacterium]